MKRAKYLIMVLILILDQVVKIAVRSAFEPGQGMDVIGKVFSLTYVQNRGAAFSLLSGHTAFLIIVPAAAMIFSIWYMEKHREEHWTLYISLALAVGGGVSNFLDRALFSYVTDMFDFHFWPVFNVADIAICTGCGLLIIYILCYYGKQIETDESGKS